MSTASITRREVLQMGVTGLGAVSLGSLGGMLASPAPATADLRREVLRLTMREAMVEMVDLTQAYMWLFDDGNGPRFPGSVIYALEGERVDIAVTNELPGERDHAFEIPGVVHSGAIRPGRMRLVKFTAPPAGTYMYQDPLNAPLNRVMGLHGVFVSLPREGNTPYGVPTATVQELFDDFGVHEAFPGYPWQPEDTKIWVFSQIDPALNDAVRLDAALDGPTYARQFQPRYFTINGRSGYFASHAQDTYMASTVGHPHLIRNVNAGIWGHSPHTHANHVYVTAVNGRVQQNVLLLDTWTLNPGERFDVVFPFVKPPDIPDDTWARIIAGTHEEPFPMIYPVHCHMEITQTAAGGNYPQGAVTHIDILGPVDQVASPGNPPPGYPLEAHRGFDEHGGHQKMQQRQQFIE